MLAGRPVGGLRGLQSVLQDTLHDVAERIVELRRRPGRRHPSYGGKNPGYRDMTCRL